MNVHNLLQITYIYILHFKNFQTIKTPSLILKTNNNTSTCIAVYSIYQFSSLLSLPLLPNDTVPLSLSYLLFFLLSFLQTLIQSLGSAPASLARLFSLDSHDSISSKGPRRR